MKKTTAIILAMILTISCIALTACGGGGGSSSDLSDSKYVGTWKAASVALKDQSSGVDFDYTLTLNGDGTGTFVAVGEEGEETSNITWSLTDDGFKTKGDTKLTFTDDGDNIKTKVIGVSLIFEKQ